MKKYLVGLCAVLTLVVPISTFAWVPTIDMSDVDPSPSTSACINLTSTGLRYRARDITTNNEVSLLQDFLQSVGYLSSEPTGYFGLLTLQAVKNFQRANGIDPTGYVGPLTRATIKKVSCNGDISPNPISGGTYYIEKLPTNTLTTGTNVIYRYKVTAPVTNELSIKGDTLYINQSGNQVNIIRLEVWDNAFAGKGPITAPHARDVDYGYLSGQVQTLNFTFPGSLVIPAGQTRYFQAIAIIDSQKDGAYFTTGHKGLEDMTLRAQSQGLAPTITNVQSKASGDFELYVNETASISGSNFLTGSNLSIKLVQINSGSEVTLPLTQIGNSLLYVSVPNTVNANYTGGYKIVVQNSNGKTEAKVRVLPDPKAATSLQVYTPKAGDTWYQDKAYTISWSAASGDFDTYEVMLGNNLVPGRLSGGPVYSPTPKHNTSTSFDSRNLSAGFIQTWITSANGQSETAVRSNFYIVVRALKDLPNGKQRVVAEGKSGVFSILATPTGTNQDNPIPSLNILSPQPNNTLIRYSTATIRWATNYINSYIPVKIELTAPNGTTYHWATSPQNSESYGVFVSNDIHGAPIPDGTYTLRLCADQGKDYCDSVGPITIR